ncbi:MAG: putative hydro-lyase [Pseudomonadota bacterium]
MDSTIPNSSLREKIRSGDFTGNTSGLAPGAVQCNLVILPADHAADFLRFCQRNPRPCPLIAVGEPGDPALPSLGDVDVRTDLPRYRIFQNGLVQQEPLDIADVWREDLVSFALGCSFSFEEALLADGLEIRNISEDRNVPMYQTNIDCQAAGVFSSKLVVSMRPFMAAEAIRAIQICSRFPAVHGAPVHLGDPTQIGIDALERPDFGDSVTVKPGEVPVFWACGVTPQLALQHAELPFAITHSPGCMLVTDLTNAHLAVI